MTHEKVCVQGPIPKNEVPRTGPRRTSPQVEPLESTDPDRELISAVKSGDSERACRLLQGDAYFNAVDESGISVLMYSSALGNDELIGVLFEKGAEIDAADPSGWTPLMYAVLMDRIEIMKMLIDFGADVNARDSEGCTPLLYACILGSPDAAELLIARGADINAENGSGRSAMSFAFNSDDRVFRLFLESGAGLGASE